MSFGLPVVRLTPYCTAPCAAGVRGEGGVVAPCCVRSPGSAKSVASFTAVSRVAASLVFAAATSEGYRTTSTDLHDGTVWTLSADRNAAARINARIDELDTVDSHRRVRCASCIRTARASICRRRRGSLNSTPSERTLRRTCSSPSWMLVRRSVLPVGRLRCSGPTGRSVGGALAGAELGRSAADRTADRGQCRFAAWPCRPMASRWCSTRAPTRSPRSRIGPRPSRLQTDSSRSPTPQPFGHDLTEPGESAADFRFSAVGSTAVALLDGEVLLEGGGSSTPDGEGLVLQRPGIAADAVVVAGDDALYRVPLGGGDAD